jgi:hypothetical protein
VKNKVLITKILCKNEKGREAGTLRAQKRPDVKSRKITDLFEHSPKYRKSLIFPKDSLPFSVFVRSVSRFAASSPSKASKPPNRFSVIQLSNIIKNEKSGDFQNLFRELLRHRS